MSIQSNWEDDEDGDDSEEADLEGDGTYDTEAETDETTETETKENLICKFINT